MSSVYLTRIPVMDPTVPASAETLATSTMAMSPSLGSQSNIQSLDEELQQSMRLVSQYCKYYTDYLQAQLFTPEGETPKYPIAPFTVSSTANATSPAAAAASSSNRNSISIPDSVRAILSHPCNLPTAVAAVSGMPVIGGPAVKHEPEPDEDAQEEEEEAAEAQVKQETKKQQKEEEEEEENEEDAVDNEENMKMELVDDKDEDYTPKTASKKPKKHFKKQKIQAPPAPTITRHGRVVKHILNIASISAADMDDDEDDEDMEDEEEDEEEDADSEEDSNPRKRASSVTHHAGADGKQRRSKLPLRAVLSLRQFFVAHVDEPFPTDAQKAQLAEECQLNVKQISDWFTNTRKRFWRPYLDLLSEEGCILFTDRFAICNCNSREAGKKKAPQGRGGKNAAAVASNGSNLNQAPKHHWMEMWQ